MIRFLCVESEVHMELKSGLFGLFLRGCFEKGPVGPLPHKSAFGFVRRFCEDPRSGDFSQMGHLFYPPDNDKEVLSGLILVTSSP